MSSGCLLSSSVKMTGSFTAELLKVAQGIDAVKLLLTSDVSK